MESRQLNTSHHPLAFTHLYGQPLYPAGPLSWLAGLWAFICGATASGAWTWMGSSLLRLLLGLLLTGPLLGLAWGAALRLRTVAREVGRLPKRAGSLGPNGVAQPAGCDPQGSAPDKAAAPRVPSLPYTAPGSASERLGHWLSAISVWWQQARPYLGRPLLQLAASSLFALTLAAQLGQSSVACAVIGLAVAFAIAFGRGKSVSYLLTCIFAPLLVAWLLGHTAYSALLPASGLAAAAFALTLCGCSAVHWGLRPLGIAALVWQVAPQAGVAACLVAVKQPIAAAAVALLGTSQLLLLPLLDMQHGSERYFRAVQFQLAASMFLAALALGYRP